MLSRLLAIAKNIENSKPYTVRVTGRCGTNLHVSRSNPFQGNSLECNYKNRLGRNIHRELPRNLINIKKSAEDIHIDPAFILKSKALLRVFPLPK